MSCLRGLFLRVRKFQKLILDRKDWFHESCLNLRERPDPFQEGAPVAPVEEPHVVTDVTNPSEDNDAASEVSSSGLPRPLICGEEYESFVCGSCVSNIDTLKRWAGTEGIVMVIRDNPSSPWKILDVQTDMSAIDNTAIDDIDSVTVGVKRPRTSSANVPDAKRPRSSPTPSGTCLAPPSNPIAQNVIALCNSPNADGSLGTGDIFLKDGWRERWCRCSSVSFTLFEYGWPSDPISSAYHHLKQTHFC